MNNNEMLAGDPEGERELPDNGLERVRKKVREEKLVHREHQREFFLKKVRFLEDDLVMENISKSDMKSLAGSIKIKSQISGELLTVVMNALLESPDNITAFLSVDGALQALLRALSGQNEKLQLIAARCISNLALGNEKQSLQVLKAAESYLLVHLSGKNHYVIDACVTALGNFSSHGVQHIKFLRNQGFFPKITHLLNDVDPTVQMSVIYALQQIIYHGFDIIELHQKEQFVLAVLPIFTGTNPSSVAFLMSLLTSSETLFPNMLSEMNKITSHALKCLEVSLLEKQNESVHYLRVVNNFFSEKTGQLASDLIQSDALIFRNCVKFLLSSSEDYLKKECLSLIGNLLNHPHKMVELFGTELISENYDVIYATVDVLKNLPADEL